MSTNFLTPGITNADFETVSDVSLETIAIGRLSTLKEFQDAHQQVFFTPALPYAWFHENHITFDPIFSDIPEQYRKHIKKLSPLPAPIVDGFYGNQERWNNTLWTIPSELWVPFCRQIGGKGYFDTVQKLVVLFSMGVCNGEDVLARLKGKHAGFISVAYIGIHTNQYSIVMSESLHTTTLSVAKAKPDEQLKDFADKFLVEDSSVANKIIKPGPHFGLDASFRPRQAPKLEPPEVCGVNDLTRAQKKRFIELSEYYKMLFDDRSADSDE